MKVLLALGSSSAKGPQTRKSQRAWSEWAGSNAAIDPVVRLTRRLPRWRARSTRWITIVLSSQRLSSPVEEA